MLVLLIIIMTIVLLMLLWMLDSTKQRAKIITQLENMVADIKEISDRQASGITVIDIEGGD